MATTKREHEDFEKRKKWLKKANFRPDDIKLDLNGQVTMPLSTFLALSNATVDSHYSG